MQKPVTHKTERKFVSCKNVTGIHALSPVSQLSTAVQRTPEPIFTKSANEKERWYSVERWPWNTRLKAHLLVLEFCSYFSKRDEFLYQKKTGKLGYRYHRVRPFVRVPLSIFSSKDSSLRTADTFPVVASLPLFRRERSDDRKCVCCSQATRTLAQIYNLLT